MYFKKRIYAKWILSGEHSVLRSQPALVFPLNHYYIDFSYRNTADPLSIHYTGQDQTGLDYSFLSVLEEALKWTHKTREELRGTIQINSSMSFGVGLGGSAMLSAACALFFQYKSWIQKEDLKPMAKKLEDFFHKTSSGVDIVAVLEGKAVLFQKGEVIKYLEPTKHQPRLYLSYSGRRSSTFLSVTKVQDRFLNNPMALKKIDKKMASSVECCLSALQSEDKKQMMAFLKEGMDVGEECFQELGLWSYELERHSDNLKKQGAVATKPTGSGLGGYVISLWNQPVPQNIDIDLKPVFI